MPQLNDTGSERTLIASIIKHGKDALIDAEGIVTPTDFSLPINRAIFLSIKNLYDDPMCDRFDIESIKMKMKTLGFGDYTTQKKDIEYLEFLATHSSDKNNIQLFALQIKKFSIIRDLYSRYTDATKYLDNITGGETLAEIIQNAEGRIVDFISGVESSNESLTQLSENLEQYVLNLLEKPQIDQIGLPTGFPIYDEAIGGGQRRGCVSIIGSRSKCGKSWMALNIGLNTAKIGIPTLYLDSELTKSYQRSRMISINSGCPINALETNKFKQDKELVKKVLYASKQIERIPLFYESIGQFSYTEVMSVIRRWIVKNVGFNDQGKANDCLVIFDYLKLTNGESLTKVTPEYIVLGLMLTEMHNFAVKYDVPFLTYVQLNREGIDGDDSSVVAGSDRILWLCSSLSLLKNKDQTHVDMGDSFDNGNKLLRPTDCRHGPGLNDGDYLNLHCSIRPNVAKEDATGLFREGFLRSQVFAKSLNNQNDQNGSRRSQGTSK